MAFARSLEPSTRSSYESGNSQKCPKHMLPQNEEERVSLWERYKEVGGDYGLIDINAKQSKKNSRKRKRPRVWTFIKDVRDKICGGNQQRATSMIGKLRQRPKYHRHHPDMSEDDENAEQVKCLEVDVEESQSESVEEIEASTKRQMSGDADTVQQDLKKLMASSAKPAAKPAAKAAQGAKGAAAKAGQGAKGAAGGAAEDEAEASDDAKRELAEKEKKRRRPRGRKTNPSRKIRVFCWGARGFWGSATYC